MHKPKLDRISGMRMRTGSEMGNGGHLVTRSAFG